MDEKHKMYDLYLEIFTYLCELPENVLILQYMVKILVTPEMKQFQIDALTNNAQYIAKYIYPRYMDLLLSQLSSSIKTYKIVNETVEYSAYASSLLYCIQSISIHLQDESIVLFLQDVYKVLDLPNQSFELEYSALQLVHYFVTNTTQPYQANNNEILPRVVPFLFQANKLLIGLANQTISNINNTLDKNQHHLNMSYIHTAFFNRYPQSTDIPGLVSFDPYVEMLIDTFVYGEDEVYQQAVQFINLVLQYATPQPAQILKIVGALIRLLNYKNTTKVPALQILYTAYAKEFLFHHFASQLQVTYLKLVVLIQDEKNGLKQLAKNYAKLFLHHPKKDLALNELFNHAGQAQTIQSREGTFKIIKTVLKQTKSASRQLFSSALLERIFVLTRQYYTKQNLTPYLQHQIASLLALTYSFASKSNKDQLQTFLNQSADHFLLLLAFKRYPAFPLSLQIPQLP